MVGGWGGGTRVYLNFSVFWTLRTHLWRSKLFLLWIHGSNKCHLNIISFFKKSNFRSLFWEYIQHEMASVSDHWKLKMNWTDLSNDSESVIIQIFFMKKVTIVLAWHHILLLIQRVTIIQKILVIRDNRQNFLLF